MPHYELSLNLPDRIDLIVLELSTVTGKNAGFNLDIYFTIAIDIGDNYFDHKRVSVHFLKLLHRKSG